MKGMEESPTPVGSQVLTIIGTVPILVIANRDERTMALIAAPGITTLAKAIYLVSEGSGVQLTKLTLPDEGVHCRSNSLKFLGSATFCPVVGHF